VVEIDLAPDPGTGHEVYETVDDRLVLDAAFATLNGRHGYGSPSRTRSLPLRPCMWPSLGPRRRHGDLFEPGARVARWVEHRRGRTEPEWLA
jgi:hypothetical protein